MSILTAEQEKKIIEQLADLEHTRWSVWQKYLHSKCNVNSFAELVIPYGYVQNLERLIKTPYCELTEKEKESDRVEARKTLALLSTIEACLRESKGVCEWKRDINDFSSDFWETSCGEAFCIEDGTPAENNMKYCHHCGKILRIKSSDKGVREMKLIEKIDYLQKNHFTEWVNARKICENEISDRQSMFCVCGRLATGFHEGGCRKFNNKVNIATVKILNHLIK